MNTWKIGGKQEEAKCVACVCCFLRFMVHDSSSPLPSPFTRSRTTRTDSHARPTHPAQAPSLCHSAAGGRGREGHPGVLLFAFAPISHPSSSRALLLFPEPTHNTGVEPGPRHRRGVLRLAQTIPCLLLTLPSPRWVCSHAGT